MAHRRGFKSEANATAREVRAELGLSMLDRLDPWALAKHLAVPILALSNLVADAPGPVKYFRAKEPEVFSAATIFRGTHRAIVHNDIHTPARQASNITHELAHALLLHDPSPALDELGCRLWNQDIEDEAQWLAGALLITEDAALWIAREDVTMLDAVVHFGVSEEMVAYRVNITGARLRVARSRRLRAVE